MLRKGGRPSLKNANLNGEENNFRGLVRYEFKYFYWRISGNALNILERPLEKLGPQYHIFHLQGCNVGGRLPE